MKKTGSQAFVKTSSHCDLQTWPVFNINNFGLVEWVTCSRWWKTEAQGLLGMPNKYLNTFHIGIPGRTVQKATMVLCQVLWHLLRYFTLTNTHSV